MRKRELGTTQLKVSELGLGTWGLAGDGYGEIEERERRLVIERALALGVTLFETADCYGGGRMEEALGELVPREPDFVIATKLGTDLESHPPCKRFERDFLERRFEASAARLKRTPVDVVLLHNPSAHALAREESTEWLKQLKEAGRIRAWGVSAGTAQAAEAAIKAGADVIQVAYNALFLRDLHPLSGAITEAKIGVFARSVLAHGLLCGHWASGKVFPAGDHRRERWTADQLAERLKHAAALKMAIGNGAESQRSVALRFALSNEQVSACILGPKSTLQLDQLVRDAGRAPPYLSSDQHRRLRARLAALGVA